MNKLLLSLLGLFAILHIQAQNAPKRELRGVWLTTHLSLDWPTRTQTPQQQRAALLAHMDHHRATGINAFYFQVRSQCDAMYESTIEPWSYYLTNKQGVAPSPFWDPLLFAIDEARKRGMEFHAWFNPYRAVANTASINNTDMYSEQHISKTKPEWMLTVGSVQVLNPGLPEVRDYVTSVVVDVLKRYDVDGIHFDDYFYPNGTIRDTATFESDPRGFTNIADWRRDNVNLLIKRVNDSILQIKPWVKFGVSPTGIYRNSTNPEIGSNTSGLQHYVSLYADTRKWIREGWVDYLMPQLYWYIGQPGADYGVLDPWWNNNAFGRHIYIGIAAYKVGATFASSAETTNWANPSQVPNQVRMNRRYPNIFGEVYFRSQHLRSNPLGFRDSLRLDLYKHPALLPTMSWRDNTPPASPSSLTVDRYGNDSVVLRWTNPTPATDELDKIRQFVIYRSTEPVIDIENGANILAITTNNTPAFTDKTVAPNTTYYYTVTAIDRFHNESASTNTANNLPPDITCPADGEIVLDGFCAAVVPDFRSSTTVVSSASQVTLTQSPAPGSAINGRGNTVVTITATDKGGNSGSCTLNLLAIDTTKPVISNASADPSVLKLPANHKMRDVTINYSTSDNCGPITKVLSVKSNEPEYGLNDEDLGPDWEIIDEHHVKLRAERDENGKGRVYTIIITVTDAAGNVSTEDVTVSVPHHVTRNSSVNQKQGTPDVLLLSSELSVTTTPNPTHDQFNMVIKSASDELINMKVTDNLGRLMEQRSNVSANNSMNFGRTYKPGVYFVEIIQGESRKVLKLIKSGK